LALPHTQPWRVACYNLSVFSWLPNKSLRS
jgi:hypothetical protein